MDKKLAREMALSAACRLAEWRDPAARTADAIINEAGKLYNWLMEEPERGDTVNLPQLPLYQCHKKVRAAKIAAFLPAADFGAEIRLDLPDGSSSSVKVDADWLTRNPKLAVGGYFVHYCEDANQYTAYSPAEPFESGYTSTGMNLANKRFDFGIALCHLKAGKRVSRSGWNGKGMWLELQVPDARSKMTLPYCYLNYPDDSKTTPGSRVPWTPSQTDVLAGDWEVQA